MHIVDPKTVAWKLTKCFKECTKDPALIINHFCITVNCGSFLLHAKDSSKCCS